MSRVEIIQACVRCPLLLGMITVDNNDIHFVRRAVLSTFFCFLILADILNMREIHSFA